MRLRSLEVLQAPQRIGSVDVFRGLAIVPVVLFHFGVLSYGYLGVDLFFVISGLLVGGLLTRPFSRGEPVRYLRFILRRGWKIWPSYYAFLILGFGLSVLLYAESRPEEIIRSDEIFAYVFFYQNYTGISHYSFGHVWSLCVEEHFYLGLPLLFLVVQRFKHRRTALLFVLTGLTIVAGFVAKWAMFLYSGSGDTYAATHNRIDALAYGVLLNLLVLEFGGTLRSLRLGWCFALGAALLAGLIWMDGSLDSELFRQVVFQSLTPLAFFLMILGAYYWQPGRPFLPVRMAGYYSYNWYLWHPIWVFFVLDNLGRTAVGLMSYLALSLTAAVVATVLIEEPFLDLRARAMDRGA